MPIPTFWLREATRLDAPHIAEVMRPGGSRFWVFRRNTGASAFYERHGCRLLELTGARRTTNA